MVLKWVRDTIEDSREKLREQFDKALKNIGSDNRVEVLREIMGEIRDEYLGTLEKILGYKPKSDIILLSDFNRILNQIGLNPPYPEVREEEGQLRLMLDVPGFSKVDLDLSCAPLKIIIEGKTEFEGTKREINKIINLPRRVIPGEAEAKLRNGVLIIKIPLAT